MRAPVTFLVVVVAARADNHGLMVQNLRGKYEHNLDHNYKYGTCGRPEWVAVSATGADPPHGSVVGGRDLNIKTEKTARGENLYICRVRQDNGGKVGAPSSDVVPGKTWFHRNDACCNAAIDGNALLGGSGDSTKDCQILTIREMAHSGSRLDWTKTHFVGDQVNQLKPEGALVTGSSSSGPLYTCRFRDDSGDFMLGHTYFPRRDGFCCTAEYNDGERKAKTHTTCEILVAKTC